MTTDELILFTLKAFQQAAEALLNGERQRARQLVNGLPEPAYEQGLAWYSRKKQDYIYYLVRYVLGKLECDPDSKPAAEDVAEYKKHMLAHTPHQPQRIRVNYRDVVIDWNRLNTG